MLDGIYECPVATTASWIYLSSPVSWKSNTGEFSLKRNRSLPHLQKWQDRTRRLGVKTTEEIGKGNQPTGPMLFVDVLVSWSYLGCQILLVDVLVSWLCWQILLLCYLVYLFVGHICVDRWSHILCGWTDSNMSVLTDGHVYVDRWSPVCVGGHICDGRMCMHWWMAMFVLVAIHIYIVRWQRWCCLMVTSQWMVTCWCWWLIMSVLKDGHICVRNHVCVDR